MDIKPGIGYIWALVGHGSMVSMHVHGNQTCVFIIGPNTMCGVYCVRYTYTRRCGIVHVNISLIGLRSG